MRRDALRVLLVEDDDADALIVEELLGDVRGDVVLQRARSFAEAQALAAEAGCVLLDLGLPDSQGLAGLSWLLEHHPGTAVVVLTGVSDEGLGAQAVRAGAQDYLFKGDVVAGNVLYRVVRYAMERLRAQRAERELDAARIYAAENARLERGLLPSPLLADAAFTVSTRYAAGGGQPVPRGTTPPVKLLGGDFYDVVEAPDGWVHALIGDVCGRGPAEAALGVCLRVAWRALVLAGQSAGQILSTLGRVLEHERADDTMFATLGMLSVAPDRATGWVRLAGHMPPLLITRGAAVRELAAPPSPPPGLGSPDDWPGVQVTLAEPPAPWSVLLFTDGLIEGRIGAGPERLGSDGLIRIIGEILATSPDLPDDQLLDQVIDRVRKLNQGDLDDDMAVLALGWRP